MLDGAAVEPALRDQILRRERGQGKSFSLFNWSQAGLATGIFPVQLITTTETQSALSDDHTHRRCVETFRKTFSQSIRHE